MEKGFRKTQALAREVAEWVRMLAGKVREQELQIPHPPMPTYNQAQPHIPVIPESLAGMLFRVQERPRLNSTQWRATEEGSQPPPLASMAMHTYA